MKLQRIVLFIFLVFFAGVFISSCSNGDKGSTKLASKPNSGQKGKLTTGEEKILSYSSEEVSLGIFFDKEGVSRSLTLKNDQKEFKGYIVIKFPEEMGISAVQWRLQLPEGIKIISDDYYRERNLTLGRIRDGLSEAFPCVYGPSLLIHTLTFMAEDELKNAVISIMPDKRGDFLGIAKCEGDVQVRASSFKAVVNPED
ncbi:hypothetical protein J7M07_01455 [bacterium]|nr:hypothetical protein [bacterium]